jgi:hypothetical protein
MLPTQAVLFSDTSANHPLMDQSSVPTMPTVNSLEDCFGRHHLMSMTFFKCIPLELWSWSRSSANNVITQEQAQNDLKSQELKVSSCNDLTTASDNPLFCFGLQMVAQKVSAPHSPHAKWTATSKTPGW